MNNELKIDYRFKLHKKIESDLLFFTIVQKKRKRKAESFNFVGMAESILIQAETKAEKYQQLIPQMKALCESESNLIANLANTCAALKTVFDFFWVGFYLVENNQLVLGPFQGPIACTRIAKGKGVCGTAWQEEKAILVPNVELFPGHIACSSESKSEVVLPIFKNNQIVAILDVDSNRLDNFDQTDLNYLTDICTWLGQSCF